MTPSDDLSPTVPRSSPSPAPRAEPGGDHVPGYAILRELGRGGMGVVYEARHLKLNRVVALKMMLGGGLVSRVEMLRFLAEAEAIAAVRHPNVVQVYDYGESDGRPYMALEYCPGGTLTELLPRKPEQATDPRGMAQLLAEVARGVAAAHAAGIVHRDLKPGNVFLDADDIPKVADFGLAKRGEGSDMTQTGVGMGTPAFMAPEQARDAKFVGPQADVWALGVILYQALTGTRPFVADTAIELVIKIGLDEPTVPRTVVRAVPRDLELICLKCLAKAPHERYPTAKELADDLDRYLRNEPISVRRAGPGERAVRWVRRNKVVSGAAAAVFAALLAGAGVSLAFGLEARRQAQDAEDAAEREKGETVRANANAEAARQAAARADAARAAAEVAYANSLLAPLGDRAATGPLTAYQVGVLWEVSDNRGKPVGFHFLEQGVGTALGVRRLRSNPAAIHAVVGLDPDRRARADRLLAQRLAAPNLSAEERTNLAVACAYWRSASPPTAAAAADAIRAALPTSPDSLDRFDLASALAAAAARMEPRDAGRVLAAALAAARDGQRLVDLALATADFDASDSPELAAARADAVRAIAAVAGKTAAVADLDRYTHSLYLLAPHAPPADVTAAARALLAALLAAQPRATEEVDRTYLTVNLSRACELLPPDAAVPVLVKLLAGPASYQALKRYSRALATVVAELPVGTPRPAAIGQYAARTVGAMRRTADPYQQVMLAEAAAALVECLPRAEAEAVATDAAALLTAALEAEGNSFAASALCHGLVVLHRFLKPADADRVLGAAAGRLADALGRTRPSRGQCLILVRAARRLPHAEAARVVAIAFRGVSAAFDAATGPEDVAEVAEGLMNLAPLLAPAARDVVKARVAARLAAATTGSSPDARLKAARVRAATPFEDARAIVAVLGQSGDTPLYASVEEFREVVLGLPPGGWVCGGEVAAGVVAAGLREPRAALPLLHPHFSPRPVPLPPPELVELLKDPFCVGPARRVVLDALQLTYGRSFKDLWAFVEYAREHQKHLDLLTPPKRPAL